MSRFWAAASSSSDSGSSSDDSSASSSSDDDRKVTTKNRWEELSDDSDSEDEIRVVKSAKQRLLESMTKTITTMRSHMKARNYKDLKTNYEELLRTVSSSKSKSIWKQQGGVPRMFIRILCDLEPYVEERKKDKAAYRKLSKSQGTALNRLGLVYKKNHKGYATLMKEYRANPTVESDDDDVSVDAQVDKDDSSSDDDNDSDSDSDSDSDDDSSSSSSSSSSASSSSGSDSDSDAGSEISETWDSESASDSDSSSDSDAGDVVAADNKYANLKGRAKWLKKVEAPKSKVKTREAKAVVEKEEVKETVVEEAKVEKITAAVLTRKCRELVKSRGKRGTDSKTILSKLEGLAALAVEFGPRVEIPILMHVMTAQFDLVRTLDDSMDLKTWQACAEHLNRVSSILEGDVEKYTLTTETEEVELMIGNVLKDNKMKDAAGVGTDVGAMDAVAATKKLINPHTGEEETEDEHAERIRAEKEANMTEEELHTIPVNGSLPLFLTRLDEEYIKSLQATSPHSAEYVTRLRDEAKMVNLLTKLYSYCIRVESTAEASDLALLRVEHLYYRHDSIATQLDANLTNSAGLINDLCKYVYEHGTDRSKTRAMLCHIFHHALHDRFLDARDLLLMSHLQDNISNVGDVNTMILFNRMMVTLGLCAFRLGKIWDAHQCLSDVCSGRVRELLAQGINTGRFAGDKTPEQEKAEKRRQVPYHQHINLDLLEAAHLISAMLLEVPNMAAHGEDTGRRARIISRNFRKNHDIYDRQVFTGPPEQTRDFVMRASKNLMKGEWKGCADLLINLDVWKLLPAGAVDQVQVMLVDKIKLEGLRTYLFAFSTHYDSLSLAQLCSMFDMGKNDVHSVISKMMINNELHASWDQPTETIVLNKVEPSSLQVLALQYSEKAAALAESNERLLDAKLGNYGYRDGDWKDQRGQQGQRNSGGRGGGRGGRGRGGRGGGRGSGRGNRYRR